MARVRSGDLNLLLLSLQNCLLEIIGSVSQAGELICQGHYVFLRIIQIGVDVV